MNSRERFLAAMEFRPFDTLPLPSMFQCFEDETLRRWRREGLPRDASHIQRFGFERCELAPVSLGLLPAGESADAAESREWEMGDRDHEDETVARSEEVRATYPLRQPAQWPAFRSRLNPASPARYPRFWTDWARHRRLRDYPLGLAFVGPLSAMREWMGVRTLSRALREDWAWVEEMADYYAEFAVDAATRAVEDIRPDFAIVRERSAYRWQSVASIDDLERVFSPWYRRVCDFLEAGGVQVRIVEAPGNVSRLIPLWLRQGYNGLCFAEVAAGLDARALRAEFGRDLALIGNIDERALATSRRDATDELLTKVPELVPLGGYIPTPDRPVSSAVSFEDYEYYLATLRRL